MPDCLAQLTGLHEADPTDPFCAYGIAMEHQKAGRSDAAIDRMKKTLEIDTNYCHPFYHMEKIHSECGGDAEAHRVLKSGMQAARSSGDEHALSEMQELLDMLNAS
jgi:hypothetical protein